MANFRFYRRARIFPGLSVNLSRSGPSLSVGVRGAHFTFGPRGVTRTVGIPGSGLSWTSHTGRSSGFHSAHVEAPVSERRQRIMHRWALAGLLWLLLLPLLLLLGLFGGR